MPRPAPTHYRLVVDGHLDEHWADRFGRLTLTHEAGGSTSLSGPVTDQAELHGLLAKVRDLGVILISLTPVDRPGSTEPAPVGSGLPAE